MPRSEVVRSTWIVSAVLAVVMVSPQDFGRAASAQPIAPAPREPTSTPAPEQEPSATPPRVSYLDGEVSFWRQGASDWAPAQLNTPLAPGDVLYAGANGTAEIQIGRAAFVRASNDTQLGLDNQEAGYLQFRLTAGHAGIDLPQLPQGSVVVVATPQAAFTLRERGCYPLDVEQ